MKVINPSNRVGLAYAGGGRVAAFHGGKEFAAGETSGFYQRHGNSTDLGVMELWRRNLEVNCNVKVTGLGKKVHISSQDCNSKLDS